MLSWLQWLITPSWAAYGWGFIMSCVVYMYAIGRDALRTYRIQETKKKNNKELTEAEQKKIKKRFPDSIKKYVEDESTAIVFGGIASSFDIIIIMGILHPIVIVLGLLTWFILWMNPNEETKETGEKETNDQGKEEVKAEEIMYSMNQLLDCIIPPIVPHDRCHDEE